MVAMAWPAWQDESWWCHGSCSMAGIEPGNMAGMDHGRNWRQLAPVPKYRHARTKYGASIDMAGRYAAPPTWTTQGIGLRIMGRRVTHASRLHNRRRRWIARCRA